MITDSKHNIFLIGIGGIGMSGLAKYFILKNKIVFGYDREKSIISSPSALPTLLRSVLGS